MGKERNQYGVTCLSTNCTVSHAYIRPDAQIQSLLTLYLIPPPQHPLFHHHAQLISSVPAPRLTVCSASELAHVTSCAGHALSRLPQVLSRIPHLDFPRSHHGGGQHHSSRFPVEQCYPGFERSFEMGMVLGHLLCPLTLLSMSLQCKQYCVAQVLIYTHNLCSSSSDVAAAGHLNDDGHAVPPPSDTDESTPPVLRVTCRGKGELTFSLCRTVNHSHCCHLPP